MKNAVRLKTGVKSFAWFVVVAALASLGIWAWQREHRIPSSIYREPGWIPARKSDRWTCIVIHHSASEVGGAERIDRWHRNKKWDGLGYDFVIGNGTDTPVGTVEVGFRWVEQREGAHCKTDDQYYNQHGIGICLVGNFEERPPDPKQMQSLARLVRFLQAEFKIPATKLYTHGGVTGKTKCPGKNFDLAQLKRMLQSDPE